MIERMAFHQPKAEETPENLPVCEVYSHLSDVAIPADDLQSLVVLRKQQVLLCGFPHWPADEVPRSVFVWFVHTVHKVVSRKLCFDSISVSGYHHRHRQGRHSVYPEVHGHSGPKGRPFRSLYLSVSVSFRQFAAR
jgi:hypothetical protein